VLQAPVRAYTCSKYWEEVWYNDGYGETEVRKETVITRSELLKRTKEIMQNPNSGRYDHCKACLARWGMI